MGDFPSPLSAKVVGSFAYKTVKDRLPVILTKVIDVLFRDRNEIAKKYGLDAHAETKAVIGYLSKLRNEMQTDKAIIPLVSNGSDVEAWNNAIEEYTREFGSEPSWFESPWVLVECYLYRRIREAFELTTLINNFDPFRDQKQSSFFQSLDTVSTLSLYLLNLQIPSNGNNSVEREAFIKENFVRFVEFSLWGNKCDLSLSSGEDVETSKDPLQQTNSLRNKILANDSLKIYDIVHSQRQNRDKLTIHVVLDNAGFELYSDLCLVDFLIQCDLVETTYFHVKEIPWFVSDVIVDDFDWLLNYLSSNKQSNLAKLGDRWKKYYEKKRWIIVKESFWTLPYDYSQMKRVDPKLYEFLSHANLIIFKGDLNYRKLTGDLNWDHSTSFETSLRGFKPAPLCTLRTIKAEVVVGLTDEIVKLVESQYPNWMYSGEFALIQCIQ